MIWSLTIAAYVGTSIALARTFGPTVGLLLYAVLTSLLTCVAGYLLRGAADGSVTWRNRVAGLFLPWASLVGGGRLHALGLKNELASIAFGIAAVVCDRMNWFATYSSGAAQQASWADTTLYGVTAACWLVMLVAWLWVIRSLLTGQSDLVSVLLVKRSVWIPLLVPPLAVGVSLGLRTCDQAWAALLVVGIPLLIVLLPVLLMASVIIFYQLIGKPIRWN